MWRRTLRHYLAEYRIRHVIHWREHEKRPRQTIE
jgi:hypothetical protein